MPIRPLEVLRALAANWRRGAPFQRQILWGMQDGRPVYGGTVARRVIERRRARNKVARRTRVAQSMARRGKR